MARKKPSEQDLYPWVKSWLLRNASCFDAHVNPGIVHGRLDVVGLRDVGGDLSGEAELVSVEVKTGGPFATAAGQASGYSVYAERCYLAWLLPKGEWFSAGQAAIASALGVGLLAIRSNHRIEEVSTAPLRQPLRGLRLRLVDAMGYAECAVCKSIFKRGDKKNSRRYVKAAGKRPGALVRAVQEEKGYMYWLREVDERQTPQRQFMYARRHLCADCASALFRDFS